ncbi:MAG: D-tyrosyl-tRNA(Tyr) deacylase [Clostridia bacterium]|nr:D-tyrosyl-tRNA(Tyr) deacylase [Clostridia bacterium]
MRAVVQRVKSSSVRVNGECVGEIGKGLNVLLGVCEDDTERDADYLAEKAAGLRIFDDADGKTNLSIIDKTAEDEEMGMLIISQFTLYGDCRKGKRPSFIRAASPEYAEKLYEYFVSKVKEKCPGLKFATGRFRTDMQVDICNDGPMTVLLDSRKEF